MIKMTKQQAIENHRKMWNWMADETLRQKRKVEKMDYFEAMEIPTSETPVSFCYCCEYAKSIGSIGSSYCSLCPVEWFNFYSEKESEETCFDPYSLYNKWWNILPSDYEEASRLARVIANLPERE